MKALFALLVLLAACGMIFGVIPTWQGIGVVQGQILSPRPGEEFAGRRDVVSVPIEVSANTSIISTRILSGDEVVWSGPVVGRTVAPIVDPGVLRTLNDNGVVELALIVSAFKQAEAMPIMGSGVSKEAGSVYVESKPVPFRILRKGDLKLSATRQEDRVRVGIWTKGKKVQIYSEPISKPEGGWSYNVIQEYLVPAGGMGYIYSKGSDDHVAVVDGSGTTVFLDLKTLAAIRTSTELQPPWAAGEPEKFEKVAIIGHQFNASELAESLAFWIGSVIACSIGATILGLIGTVVRR